MSSNTNGNDEDGTTGVNTTKQHQNKKQKQHLPKVIVFDLDGCLWRPEMYELLYFSGGFGAPFTVPPPRSDDADKDAATTNKKNNNENDGITTLLTCNGEPVYLLGDVADIFRELYTDVTWQQHNVRVGISSRTDQPDWARELLHKFQITRTTTTTSKSIVNDKNDNNESNDTTNMFSLQDVIDNAIVEISSGSKVQHFQNIQLTTGVDYKDMIFFDNEYGNCEQVSKQLGVLVGYCPKTGVTKQIWDATLSAFDEKRNGGRGGGGEDVGSGSGAGQIIQV